MVWIIILASGIAGIAVVTAAFFLDKKYGTGLPGFSQFAQGLAAIVTVVALFIAGGIYFLERRDKPRVEFDVTATRALIPARSGRSLQVLLGIRIVVKNNGTQQMTMNCMALDLSRPGAREPIQRSPGAREPLPRSPGAPEEMLLEQFSERIPYPARVVPACVAREERRGADANIVRPLYMWPPLVLEAGETDDGYFEIPVDCNYPFVRVLVKMRIRPGDDLAYETKAIIPLREICMGRGDGMAASVTAEGNPISAPPVASTPARE